MDDLTKLAIKNRTDKWGKHKYTPVYFDLFKDKRDKVKKVLEIGSAENAGVKMFRDFFPKAMIYGAEVDLDRVERSQEEKERRIKVYQCDQTNGEDILALLNTIGYDLDLIIDDGSHKPEDQVFTFNFIFPKLVDGAIYVIEDVADESIYEKLKFGNSKSCAMMKLSDRYDDRLIIVKK